MNVKLSPLKSAITCPLLATTDHREVNGSFTPASDTLAIGVLPDLASRGLRPGADIGVVGFDDSQAAQVFPGGLTSVRQPLEDVAVEIVHAVERLLSSDAPGELGRLLSPTLAVRGSTER